MKKTIKFSKELSHDVLIGVKRSTWRLFDDKDLQMGDSVDFLDKSTLEKIGEGELLSVVEKELKDLDESDYEEHDKYESTEQMYAEFQKYYPDEIVNENTKVKIIKFSFNKIKL